MNSQNQTAVETAKQNLESAKAEVANIQQAIASGNEKLRGSDLRRAKDELEFCELRLKAAIEREEKQREADRLEKISASKKQIIKMHGQAETLEKALVDAIKPLDDVLSKIIVHNQEITEKRQELENLGLRAEPGGDAQGIQINWGGGYGLIIGEIEVKEFQAREKLERLVSETLQKYFPIRGR